MTDQATIIVKPFGIVRWKLLVDLCEPPPPDAKHQGGGFQARRAKWKEALDHVNRTITLDPDDVDWTQRKLRNRKGGGWQQQISDIFYGQHPLFSNIPADPPKRPEDRKKRTPPSPALLA